uniref:Uncharacterized protein n=1 Tax=Oryctolagus cuniculus TaxID=9986 RepID=A0A5F9CSH3_RABIT
MQTCGSPWQRSRKTRTSARPGSTSSTRRRSVFCGLRPTGRGSLTPHSPLGVILEGSLPNREEVAARLVPKGASQKP